MRTLLLILATAGVLALPATPSEATSDRRSALERSGRGGQARPHVPPQRGANSVRPFEAWQGASWKRCPACRRPERARSDAGGPSIPEPSGALLFGLGALALRSRLGAGRGSR